MIRTLVKFGLVSLFAACAWAQTCPQKDVSLCSVCATDFCSNSIGPPLFPAVRMYIDRVLDREGTCGPAGEICRPGETSCYPGDPGKPQCNLRTITIVGICGETQITVEKESCCVLAT